MGPVAATIWYVECEDDWHTYIDYSVNTLVMDGKVNVQDLTRYAQGIALELNS